LLLGPTPIAPQGVDRTAPRGGEYPRSRMAWEPLARPPLERRDVCIADRVFGSVNVAERAREHGDATAGVAPKACFDAFGISRDR